MLQQRIHRDKQEKRDTYIALLDITRAYDSVDREKKIELLENALNESELGRSLIITLIIRCISNHTATQFGRLKKTS